MSTQILRCSNCGNEIGGAQPIKVLRWSRSIDAQNDLVWDGIAEAICEECCKITGLKCDQ